MGGGNWDTGYYKSAAKSRRDSGIDDFDYTDKVRRGKASGIHKLLDPKTVAGPTSLLAGQNVRESRDSDEHPESLPIAIIFDVTGSMGGIPRVLQKKLANLMDVIIDKAGVKDPQVLVGAVGDSYCDRYPFQVGQFESDNRFDEQLRKIILEGGGGGQDMESYGLAYRFAAYHTATDAYEKRGKKGYFFTMGDEAFWPDITKKEVSEIFGVGAEKDESVADLLLRAQEKWEIFHLFSVDGSYANDKSVHDRWRNLLGERFVMVEDSSLVCEVIAGIIHMFETVQNVDDVVDDIGLSGNNRDVVKNALVPVSKGGVLARMAKGTIRKAGGKKGGTIRRI